MRSGDGWVCRNHETTTVRRHRSSLRAYLHDVNVTRTNCCAFPASSSHFAQLKNSFKECKLQTRLLNCIAILESSYCT